MKAKRAQESHILLSELMVPSFANFGGSVHGGVLLSLMDKAAYVCASKFAEAYCVTVAVEGVEFLNPVKIVDFPKKTGGSEKFKRLGLKLGMLL